MRRRLFVLTICLCLLLAGCGTAAPAGETFTDSTGAQVPVPESLDTVAVLFSSYAEAWTLAGGTVAVTVGDTVERGFASAEVILVDAGAGHTAIDAEALLAAEPDLVIGTADYPCQVEAAEICAAAGVPAALFRQETAEDYFAMFRIFCDLTGDEAAWETYGEAVRQDLADAMEEARGLPAQRILLVRAGSSQRSTKAKGAGDLLPGAMLRDLGMVNIADEAPVLLDGLSLEHIVTEDPRWLFVTTMGDEAAAVEYMESLLDDPGWRDLTCVREGRVVYLDRELYHYKPNHRWPEAYAGLTELLRQG